MSVELVFTIALIIGALMLCSVCFVYIRYQRLQAGGIALAVMGFLLLGASTGRYIELSFDQKGLRDRLHKVEEIATKANRDAKLATDTSTQISQSFAQLKKNVYVAFVQEKLKAAGLYSGASDGNLGPATQTALMRLQAVNGLAQTGELDENTMNTLQVGAYAHQSK